MLIIATTLLITYLGEMRRMVSLKVLDQRLSLRPNKTVLLKHAVVRSMITILRSIRSSCGMDSFDWILCASGLYLDDDIRKSQRRQDRLIACSREPIVTYSPKA